MFPTPPRAGCPRGAFSATLWGNRVGEGRHSLTSEGPVVVGIDDSDGARVALAWATRNAVAHGRSMILVHGVGDDVALWRDISPGDAQAVTEAYRRSGTLLLQQAAARVRAYAPDLDVTTANAPCGLREAVRVFEHEASMIVLGATAHGRLSPVLNVTYWAVHEQVACPVAVACHVTGEHASGLMVLVDGTSMSQPTLDYAVAEAEARGLPLTLVHCVPDPGAPGTDLREADRRERRAAERGPSLLGFQRRLLWSMAAELGRTRPDLKVSVVVDEADVDLAIATAATAMDELVFDHSYWRRACEQVYAEAPVTEIRCSAIVLPVRREAVDTAARAAVLGRLARVTEAERARGTREEPAGRPDLSGVHQRVLWRRWREGRQDQDAAEDSS